MSIEIKNVLFPTDFSELAQCALAYARELTSVFPATLHCLHVVDEAYQYWSAMGPESIPVGPPPDEMIALTEKRMATFRAEHLAGLAREPVTHVALGHPFAEIIGYARDKEIDLIVMATHGRSALAHVFLGGTTEKVVRKAPCAVLTVRAGDHQLMTP